MINNEQLISAEVYVTNFFKHHISPTLTYHDIVHTRSVVKRASAIADHCSLSKEQKNIVLMAAWFHDIGYVVSNLDHEERSVQIATEFLKSSNTPEHDIEQVAVCIRATKFPQQPTNFLSCVMCDADMSHLAHRDFFEISLLFRDEINSLGNVKMTLLHYWQETKFIFERHHYHTPYGQTVLAAQKQANYEKLKEKILQCNCYNEPEAANEAQPHDELQSKAVHRH